MCDLLAVTRLCTLIGHFSLVIESSPPRFHQGMAILLGVSQPNIDSFSQRI